MDHPTANPAAPGAAPDADAPYRALVEAAPQFIWRIRPDGVTDFANRAWCEYSGLTLADNYRWGDALHADDRQRTVAAWRAALTRGEMFEIEYRLRRAADGAFRWHLARVSPHRDAGGNLMYWIGVATDVHTQKLAEDARQQSEACLRRDVESALERERAARAEADAANQAKDRFLAVLSHELRTPLTPVVLAIGAMEADPALPPHLRDDVQTIRRNIDLETKLIDDLLDSSRVASGKLALHPQAIGVHELLHHVLEICGADLLDKKLNIVFDLRAHDDRVHADPARLQQVFWNLVKNAVKFTPPRGRVVIRTGNARPGHIEVEVRDTGVGIAPDVLPRIFHAFEQGDPSVTRQFGGLGLGLAISKTVVDLHGGTLTAHSDGHGHGAAFVVDLATLPAASPDAAPPPPPDDGRDTRAPISRVLLVEDHTDTARLLAKLLTRQGFRVRTAHTVAAALDLAAAEPFDIVVSDIGLPDASGYELMAQLRDRYGAKGIALSGFGMEEDMRKSREAGFVDHVVKPIDSTQLQAALKRVAAMK
jgi:PAS domain S-box-containing protein